MTRRSLDTLQLAAAATAGLLALTATAASKAESRQSRLSEDDDTHFAPYDASRTAEDLVATGGVFEAADWE